LVHDSSCSSKCGTKTGPLSVLMAGGTQDPRKGTLCGARCGVYQPFTIETLIFYSATGSSGNALSIPSLLRADLVTA
ncbi:hypothetical protein J7E83_03750, partial [Arthrobacter sp. ISL-48]|uniref:hypothetical protein n=1 Tax=Arthrobacter sp. ISL-48 TaxID=2819110 RepID=UPI001BEA3E8C